MENAISREISVTSSKQFDVVLIALFFLTAILIFADTISYGFVSDDFYLVHRIDNEGFYTGWGGANGDSYLRPVTVLSYSLDHFVWRLNPAGYHLTNVLWHVANSILVGVLAGMLLRDKQLAVVSSFLFLFLACHSESVSWISGRTDLIATAFYLCSTIMILKGSWWAIPLFALGLLSKESVVVGPIIWGVLILAQVGFNKRNRAICTVGALIVFLYIAFRSLEFSNSTLNSYEFSFAGILENTSRYIFRVFIPPLSMRFRPVITEYPAIIPLLLITTSIVMWILYRRKKDDFSSTRTAHWLMLFPISLLPVILMKVSLIDSQGERFLYLPGVFAIFALIGWMNVVFPKKAALVLLLLLTLFQGFFLYRSNQNWKIAGQMCVDMIQEVGSGSFLRDDLPDNYKGAYVFRNGFPEAILLYQENR